MSIPFIRSLKDAVLFVALANLAYFGVEFGIAVSIHSVSLFADSIDFLEDASVNLLILLGLAWPARWRARLGMVLAALLHAASGVASLLLPEASVVDIGGLNSAARAINFVMMVALVTISSTNSKMNVENSVSKILIFNFNIEFEFNNPIKRAFVIDKSVRERFFDE